MWQAITDSECTRRYFHGTSFVEPPVAGAAYRTVAAEPPGRVDWTVNGVGEGLTRVRLVHGDLAYSPLTWAHVKDGWVWIIDALKTLLETGHALPGPEVASPVSATPEGDWHRRHGAEANDSVNELLDHDRTPDEDEDLLRRAYAAAYHWQRATGATPETRRQRHSPPLYRSRNPRTAPSSSATFPSWPEPPDWSRAGLGEPKGGMVHPFVPPARSER